MDNESISTQFDDLLGTLKRAGGSPLSVTELAARCSMPEKDVMKWLHVLERSEHVTLENKLEGVYASWTGKEIKEPEPERPHRHEQKESTFEISIARDHEKLRGKPPEVHKVKVAIESADMEMADVGSQLEKVEEMIQKLRMQRAKTAQLTALKAQEAAKERAAAERAARERQEEAAKQAKEREEALLRLAEEKEKEVLRLAKEKAAEKKRLEEERLAREKEKSKSKAQDEPLPSVLTVSEEEKELLFEPGAKEKPQLLKKIAKMKPVKIASAPVKTPKAEPQPERGEEPEPIIEIRPVERLPKSVASRMPAVISIPKTQKADVIKKPQPVHIAPQSLQFSDRLATQVKKIIEQTQEIEKLRLEKERILKEHYLPMQRKLDIEVETISDRVLRMEKGILSMQERASQLPSKVTTAEKLQVAAVKAHKEMRRAYDEASALIEEATGELSSEREKMELIVDQSRQELSVHAAKREELERQLKRLEEMEEQAEGRVMQARSALAEQAERLSAAENFLQELSTLKDEIHGSVGELKSEIATTKTVLTGIQKQMEQMRQVELWAESIRQDYDTKMADLDDYIRKGNQEFDTLRESVETNFVRRYLRELRQLTESYTYEFDQAKRMEKGVDEQIDDEKKKLEGLLEEGRRIAQLYELQAGEVPGAEKFEERGEMFRSLSQIASERGQIENMIAQIVGTKTEYEQKVSSAPLKAKANRKVARRTPPNKTHGKKGKKR